MTIAANAKYFFEEYRKSNIPPPLFPPDIVFCGGGDDGGGLDGGGVEEGGVPTGGTVGGGTEGGGVPPTGVDDGFVGFILILE